MVVTISREYGAGGLGVAEGVARELGYALLTDDLPKAVAERLGTSPDVAASATIGPSLGERILGGMGAATPELVPPALPPLPDEFDETVRREIERTLRERAAAGNLVILGRNGGAVLTGLPNLVRVFLTAAFDWRVDRIVETFHQKPEEARADIARVDAARRKFAKDRYRVAWGDARHYDLIVDTSRFGIDGAIDVIVDAVRAAERLAR